MAEGKQMNFHHRAVDLFTRASNEMLNDFKAVNTDHAARGMLQSGATVRLSLRSFEDRSAAALEQALREVAHVVDHRGKAWRDAIGKVERALEEHIASAPEVLDDQLTRAGLSGGTANVAAETLLGYTAVELLKQVDAFRQGLTAPRPRSWVERYPVAWGLIVRRQNIRHNSRRRLAECGPRQGVDVRRRTCGAASADVRWSVA